MLKGKIINLVVSNIPTVINGTHAAKHHSWPQHHIGPKS